MSCPCPINTGPPGPASGIQAARAQGLLRQETQLEEIADKFLPKKIEIKKIRILNLNC